MKQKITLLVALILCIQAAADAKILKSHQQTLIQGGESVKPVIGIFAEPAHFDDYPGEDYQYVINSNIEWLNQAGADVAIISFDETVDYYDSIFSQINGLMFPGGSLNIKMENKVPGQTSGNNQYTTNAAYLFNKALSANDDGDVFPVWGTCQGFYLLQYIVNEFDDTIFNKVKNDFNLTHTIQFKEDRVPIINEMPQNLIDYSQKTPSYLYVHQFGVFESNYENDSLLEDFFQIGGTTTTADGVTYIALIQAKEYPVIGMQAHPEFVLFEDQFAINKSKLSVEISKYLAKYFVDQASKNEHKFDSAAKRKQSLASNYPSEQESIFKKVTLVPRRK